jgi:hypothetical protein
MLIVGICSEGFLHKTELEIKKGGILCPWLTVKDLPQIEVECVVLQWQAQVEIVFVQGVAITIEVENKQEEEEKKIRIPL